MNLSGSDYMIKWRIGCSGYHYPEWKGLFYPAGMAKSKWFEFYCQHFNTLELNVTFYRFPRVEFLKSWYNRSPSDFTFTVKAPRLITHFKKMKEAQNHLSDFYHIVKEGLQEKAACVLFQFPPSFSFEEERLDRIIRLLDSSILNVVEFRHQSWWKEEIFQSLAQHNIVFSGMSHPSLPYDVIRTTRTVYYRFHGVPRLYISSYKMIELEQIVRQVQQLEGVEEGYFYFNNTAEGAAIKNAYQLQEISELVH